MDVDDIGLDLSELSTSERNEWKSILIDYRQIIERKISLLNKIHSRKTGIAVSEVSFAEPAKKHTRFHRYCKRVTQENYERTTDR